MNLFKTTYSIISGIIFCFFIIPAIAYSQNTVKQLSNTDGLSNNSVNCIFEDSEQTIWIGTWDGLNSYNGRDFKTYRYNRNNKSSISNNVIRQILELDPNYLWIATDYGVNRWNKQSQGFTNYFLGTEHQIPKQERSFLIGITSRKDIICYVKQQGLFRFDTGQQTFIPVNHSLIDGTVKTFAIDRNDNIYFLYENGKLHQSKLLYQDKEITLSQPRYLEQEKPVSNIFMLHNNMLVLNYPGYLKIIDDKNLYPSTIDFDKNKTISQVVYYKDNLLISYYEGGCETYNLDTKVYQPIQSISPRISIFSLFSGSQDILWIGTDGQGILKVYEYDSPFKTVYTNHPVRSFCQYNRNEILVGTKGDGVKILEKETGKLSDFLNINSGLISNSVYTIKKNQSGDIFIGTEGEGINILSKDKQLYRLSIPAKYPAFRAVYSIHFTSNDSLLWLGTSGYGLIKIALTKRANQYEVQDIEQYTSADKHNSLNNNVIYSITSGVDKNQLWLGTRGGGISRFNIEDKSFERIEDIDNNLSLTNNDVLSLTRDTESLWIGTSYGLNRLGLNNNLSGIREYTEREGLANNTIHGILEDETGGIWISTNQGISHINLSDHSITNYSSKDGLQNDEFSDGAYYKDEEKILYFGGVNGFNYFNPEKIHLRDFNPSIGLSNLRIFNTAQNINERINDNTLKLAYDEAYVTFSFIARDFINNENCEYDYRLLNFSDEWINNGNNPNIVFTKLPPGEYQLEVKVTNGDRVWGDNIYTLSIDVAYPWWLSTVAFIIYTILALIIVYIAYSVIRNRIRLNRQLLLEHIEKQNQQKMHESKLNFFTNVAHEFFTPLTLIYGPAQHLLEKADLDGYTKRYIQIIKNNADRMQKLINELMEFRKVESGHAPLHPESIDIKLLIEYITDNYTEIAQENKIEFKVETDSISTIITDRNSLEKIIFNLISNAFKYTPANGFILISVTQNNNLHIRIKNSGKGLTDRQMSEVFNRFKILETSKLQNSTSTGIGLGLTKSLTEMLGGEISVSSKLGEYVMFEINIPPMKSNQLISSIDSQNDEEITISPQIFDKKDISILIVEDEKNIRELLKDILSPYYNVSEAGDGEEALSMIEMNMPDIILSDVLMPNMDGMGLIDKLKSDPKTAHIPIINVSAKSSVEDHINAYQHGADLYITKPFHPRHVLTTVQNLVNKRSVLKDFFNSSLSSITVKDGITIHQDDERLLQEIVSFIEKNMDDESLNPSVIADALGLSKATLYRKLKDTADKTPSEFVRTIRLNYASQLLITTKLTVSEIMFKSGFTNKSYFYREFSKQYDMSPKEYRLSKTKE